VIGGGFVGQCKKGVIGVVEHGPQRLLQALLAFLLHVVHRRGQAREFGAVARIHIRFRLERDYLSAVVHGDISLTTLPLAGTLGLNAAAYRVFLKRQEPLYHRGRDAHSGPMAF